MIPLCPSPLFISICIPTPITTPLPFPAPTTVAHKGNVKQRVKCAMSLIRCACAPLTARSSRPVPTRSAAISLRQLPLIAFVFRVIPCPIPPSGSGDQDGDSGSLDSFAPLNWTGTLCWHYRTWHPATLLPHEGDFTWNYKLSKRPPNGAAFVFWQEGAITSECPKSIVLGHPAH